MLQGATLLWEEAVAVTENLAVSGPLPRNKVGAPNRSPYFVTGSTSEALLHLAKTLPFIIREHPVNIHDDQQSLGVVKYAGDKLLAHAAGEHH